MTLRDSPSNESDVCRAFSSGGESRDPDLDREVGLLWLGEEFAQLDEEFCTWSRSGTGEQCSGDDLNRSAFVAWVDCRL